MTKLALALLLLSSMSLAQTTKVRRMEGTASPQPRPPSRYVRIWNMSICNDGDEPEFVNDAVIIREFGQTLSILNPYSRSYEQTRSPQGIGTRILDFSSDAGVAFISAVGTGAIEYKGPLTTVTALVSGGWKIGKRYLDLSENKGLIAQPFWDDRLVKIDPNHTCVSYAVAVLRPEDKKTRKELESSPIRIQFRTWEQKVESKAPPEMPNIAPLKISIDERVLLAFYPFEDRETSVVF